MTKGQKARSIIGYIFFGLVILLLTVAVFFISDFIELQNNPGEGAAVLGAVFGLLIIIILTFIVIIFALACAIVSLSLLASTIKGCPKGIRITNIIMVALNGIFIAAAITLFTVAVIFSNMPAAA